MGGELWMIPDKGEAKKIKKIFPNKSTFVCPRINNDQAIGDFWVTWNRNKLELGYSFGSPLNGEWTLAVALEIARRFKIKKAGWDSVGYCKTMDEFMQSKIFAYTPPIIGWVCGVNKLRNHYKEQAEKLLTPINNQDNVLP